MLFRSMRASELQSRPWIPDSGWPLALEELEPYYRRVERLLRIEGPPYDESAWQRLHIAPPALDPTQFCIRFSQWAALGRRNFAVLWRRELERSANVSVLLDATTTAVRCVPGGDRCEAMSIRSRSGREALVRARWYVIACGGIETARLLLASPTSNGRSVANSSGMVGRFFQDHVSYVAGEVEPASRRIAESLGSTFTLYMVLPT